MKEKIEAVLLEEIRGEQDITDFYNLVNSPVTPSSKEHNPKCTCDARRKGLTTGHYLMLGLDIIHFILYQGNQWTQTDETAIGKCIPSEITGIYMVFMR